MRIRLALLSGSVALFSLPARAQWNLTPGVTEVSETVYGLHMLIFWICVVIGVAVFGVMFWALFHHRKSRGAKAAHFHENTWVEVVWTLIPFAILVGMAIPSTAALIKMYTPGNATVDIQITGYQWKWRYQYLNEEIDFFSSLSTPREAINNQADKGEHYLLEVDNPLVIPAGQRVRFLVTANDVIHSWWVPALAVKKDAIPGFINEAWTEVPEPGVYRGQCAELCGRDHGFMPIVVEVKSEQDYAAWVEEQRAAKAAEDAQAEQTWTLAQLMELGEPAYMRACAACHQPDGSGLPGVFPPLKDSPMVIGDIEAHIDIVLHGKQGTAMQAFLDQLSTVELAAIITYERNAWGNNTGEIISPQMIKAARMEGE